MSIVLTNQVYASDRSADELGAQLLRESGKAIVCRDVEDLLRTLVCIVNDMNRHVEDWQQLLQTERDPEVLAELRKCDWESLYRKLDSTFGKAGTLMQKMEAWGFDVDGKTDFLTAYRDLKSIVSFSGDRVRSAAENLRNKNGKELGAFLHELRRNS